MKVIFICTGNTCRSPMAEGYLASMHLPGVTVQSRGLFTDGSPVSQNAKAVMLQAGIDVSGHISKTISATDLDADLLICVTENHAQALINAGVSRDKITVLNGGIDDPFGHGVPVYRACRDQIFAAVDRLVFGGKILPFTVSLADKSDIDGIAALESEAFADPWSRDAISESMNASTLFFTAKANGFTAGYAGLSIAADQSYVTNIAVSEKYRQKGIGSLLLCRAVSEARNRKMSFISLEVRKSNNAAINLYKKHLFSKEGIRKDFYIHPREDAIIMTRRFFDVDTGN